MKLNQKIILKGFVFLLIFFIILFLLLFKYSSPFYEGIIPVNSIDENITIEWDYYGVPHIAAKTKKDLFFAIGFLHAKERLFQMELSRRLAQGRLAEIFGKIALQSDIEHKSLLVDESIERAYNEIKNNKELLTLLESYSKGVNYFIKTQSLPPEFKILGYVPEEWSPKDTISILRNMEMILESSGGELYHLKVISIMGKKASRYLFKGFYGSTIVNDSEYNKIFGNKTIASLLYKERILMEMAVGSNNWVVSGKLTDTGKPYLANDPHLRNIVPGYFFEISAEVGDFKLEGNTLPGTPFVIIGRNSYIGWGFTNIGTDVIDYFKLRVNKERDSYYIDGKWKKFKVLKKKIKVKNNKDYTLTVLKTPFGPVVEENGVYFLRHSVMDYKTSILEAIYGMNFSKNIKEFMNSLSKFSAPAQNVVFADISGNIGYYPTGLVPKRRKGNGTLPAELLSKNDLWNGFYREDEKPIIVNPEKGYIVTANNPVVSEDKLPLFSYYFSRPSFRADRIDELIRKKKRLTLKDMVSIQTDTYSKAGEFLIESIKNYKPKSFESKELLKIFTNWNYRMDKGIEPYLFYKSEKNLAQEIFVDELKDENDKIYISVFWLYRIMNYPEFKENDALNYFSDNKKTEQKETFFDMVEKALKKTYKEWVLDEEKRELSWEKIHIVEYKHPLLLVPVLGKLFEAGKYYMPGGRSTILRADFKWRRLDFGVTHFSTFRMILDLGKPNNSLIINSTGQSGNPFSPFYKDQNKLYTKLMYRKFVPERIYKKMILIKK